MCRAARAPCRAPRPLGVALVSCFVVCAQFHSAAPSACEFTNASCIHASVRPCVRASVHPCICRYRTGPCPGAAAPYKLRLLDTAASPAPADVSQTPTHFLSLRFGFPKVLWVESRRGKFQRPSLLTSVHVGCIRVVRLLDSPFLFCGRLFPCVAAPQVFIHSPIKEHASCFQF